MENAWEASFHIGWRWIANQLIVFDRGVQEVAKVFFTNQWKVIEYAQLGVCREDFLCASRLAGVRVALDGGPIVAELANLANVLEDHGYLARLMSILDSFSRDIEGRVTDSTKTNRPPPMRGTTEEAS
jgi:hypothetical protein